MLPADVQEGIAKLGVVALVLGLLCIGGSYVWQPLGIAEPHFTDEENEEFKLVASAYYDAGHGIPMPDNPQGMEEFHKKLQPAKEAYERQVAKVNQAHWWHDRWPKFLFGIGAGLALVGGFVSKVAEGGRA